MYGVVWVEARRLYGAIWEGAARLYGIVWGGIMFPWVVFGCYTGTIWGVGV